MNSHALFTAAIGMFELSFAVASVDPQIHRDWSAGEHFNGVVEQVAASAIPANMRFKPVLPRRIKGLTFIRTDWWKFPKTNLRPVSYVAVVTIKDEKSRGATLLAYEWKHVPGQSALQSHLVDGTPLDPAKLLGVSSLKVSMRTQGALDVGMYSRFNDITDERFKEIFGR